MGIILFGNPPRVSVGLCIRSMISSGVGMAVVIPMTRAVGLSVRDALRNVAEVGVASRWDLSGRESVGMAACWDVIARESVGLSVRDALRDVAAVGVASRWDLSGRESVGLAACWDVIARESVGLAVRDALRDVERVGVAGRWPVLDVPIFAGLSARWPLPAVDQGRAGIAIRGGIGDPPATIRVESVRVLIDGVAVDHALTGVRISEEMDSIHAEVSLSLWGAGLFAVCDPSDRAGEHRISVEINDVERRFLIETRSGDGRQFEVTGRSLSAWASAPWAEAVTVSVSPPVMASALAASLLPAGVGLVWSIHDWLVIGWEAEGTPAELIAQLAGAVGGVVRPGDAGGLSVVYRRVARPVDAQVTPADVRPAALLDVSVSDVRGDGWGAVLVEGYAAGIDAPDLELEELPVNADGARPERYIGTASIIRVYWAGGTRPADIEATVSAYVTDGRITSLGFTTATETERITFTDGRGSVARPILDGVQIGWIGVGPHGTSWEPGGRDLVLTGDGPSGRWAIGDVTYRTEYERFYCVGQDVEMILAAFELGLLDGGISIRVEVTAGGPEAETIQEPLLSDVAGARLAGIHYLDGARYNRREASVSVPHDAGLRPGVLIFLDDADIGRPGNYYVTGVTTEISGPRVSCSVEATYYEVD